MGLKKLLQDVKSYPEQEGTGLYPDGANHRHPATQKNKKTPTHAPGSFFIFQSTYLPSLEKIRLRLLPLPVLFPENPLKQEFLLVWPEPLELPLFLPLKPVFLPAHHY
ncbi:MAG: hypothetical protein EA393_08525 [Bacteroidetes bacterium]|nr:MAG: hypothetical protein EA393_08525 [Bacteroidota bacterium]